MQNGSRQRLKNAMETRPFDAANYLETEEDILYYLEAAMEGNDPKHIASALGDVARSKGMTEIANKSGLGRAGALTMRFRKMAIRRWKRWLRCSEHSGWN